MRRTVCVLLALVALVALVACDRGSGGGGSSNAAQGPPGPAGPPGPTGPRGLPGRDAAGGNATPRGVFDVTDFGALGNGFADDTAAVESAIAAAAEVGGGVIWFPPGQFPISRPLEIGGRDHLTFRGSGVDATVLVSTSPTAPIFNSSSNSFWRLWEDMTLTSSVRKTGGALMHLAQERRSTIRRVKLSGHFDGIRLDAFEVVTLDLVHITNPSGPGTAIVVGVPASQVQGSNLTIRDCFLRGSDGPEGVGGANIGQYGVSIFDADAVFMINTDIGNFVRAGMRIEPQTRSANHHFLQSFFDATAEGPCVDVGGPGYKGTITFTGSWFASAGRVGPGSQTESVGLRLRDEGTYGPWNIAGGRVAFTVGRGIEVLAGSIELSITGVQFETIGRDAIYVDTNFNSPAPHVSSATFIDAFSGNDIVTSSSANRFTITASRGNGRIVCGTPPSLNSANLFRGGSLGCN